MTRGYRILYSPHVVWYLRFTLCGKADLHAVWMRCKYSNSGASIHMWSVFSMYPASIGKPAALSSSSLSSACVTYTKLNLSSKGVKLKISEKHSSRRSMKRPIAALPGNSPDRSIRRVRRSRLLGTNGKVLWNQHNIRSPRVAARFWRRIEGRLVDCRAKLAEPKKPE